MSSGYKRFIYENGSVDETYDGDKTALFRVQGSGPENMQAIQVDLVSWLLIPFQVTLISISCLNNTLPNYEIGNID